jgi:predicted nucleotidyltransferase
VTQFRFAAPAETDRDSAIDQRRETTMTQARIAIPQPEIEAFCRKHHIRRLALFGSVLRDDFTDESDVDVLVEFEPEHVPGWEFCSMQRELSEILGRQVDLNTAGFLSPYFRDEVLAEAENQYVAA